MTDKKDRDDLTSITDLDEFEHSEENIDELFDSAVEESEEDSEALSEMDMAFSEDEFSETSAFADASLSKEDEQLTDYPIDEQTKITELPDSTLTDFELPETNNSIDNELESKIEETLDFNTKSEEQIVEEIKHDPLLEEKYENETPIAQELQEELSKEMEAHIPHTIPMEHIPSFSLKITGIHDKYDGEDVLRILREFLNYSDDEENLWIRAVERGEVLIPRVGEYVAITIAHKLRHINARFQLGLSEEIFDTPVEEIQKGPVNHHTLSLNKSYSYDAEKTRVPIKEVLTSTTAQIENAQIKNYFGIAMEEKTVDIMEYHSNIIELNTLDEKTKEFEQFGFKDVYRELIDRLKHHAMNKNANGVINIQFQNIPLPKEDYLYKIICSGTLVWIEKR